MSTIVPPTTPTQVHDEQALYRFFAEDGSLLYVGISLHPFARMGQHRNDKSWWGEVASVTIERFPDRESVVEAERTAIKAEGPRYNIVHAGRRTQPPRPKLWVTYTYWEAAIGEVLSIANVWPMHPGRFLIQCEQCGTNFIANDITDHGADDFLARGTCCNQSVVRYVPRRHPGGNLQLSEQSPYLFVRRRS